MNSIKSLTVKLLITKVIYGTFESISRSSTPHSKVPILKLPVQSFQDGGRKYFNELDEQNDDTKI